MDILMEALTAIIVVLAVVALILAPVGVDHILREMNR